MSDHWEYMSGESEEEEGQYNKLQNGTKVSGKYKVSDTLPEEDWDIISIQQFSSDFKDEGMYPYVENITKYIKNLEPDAEIVIYQHWPSYSSSLITWNNRFQMLKEALDRAAVVAGNRKLEDSTSVSPGGRSLRLVPSGRAFDIIMQKPQFLSAGYDGISLYVDANHASEIYGKYLAGAVWYEAVTGNRISDNPYIPPEADESVIEILKEAAHQAVTEYGWHID